MRKKFVRSFILAALLLAVTVISASAAVTVSKNYVYDASFDPALVNITSGAVAGESYQYNSGDVAGEGDEFYSDLPNPGTYSGGEILSVFTVYGVTSPDLIDKVKYMQVPDGIGNEAGQLYLYFVTELVSGDAKPVLTTVATVAVGSGYDKDKKLLEVTVPEKVTSSFWNPVTGEGEYASTRLILVKATGNSPAATAPVITTTEITSAIVSEDYSFTLKATGTAPITWSITRGSLPTGLSLSGDVIGGIAEKEESSTFTVKAENSAGSVTGEITLNVWSYTEQTSLSADIVGEKPEGVTEVTTADASGSEVVKTAYNGIKLAKKLGFKVGAIETKQIEAIRTSFLVNVSHDETASGDIKLKVTLGTPVTLIKGAKYYLLIPEKEAAAEMMGKLAVETKLPTFASFAADEISSKDVTFTVKDFNKYFTEAPVFLAAVKEAAPDTNAGGSSSGCSAGAGAFALMALLPLVFMRKKH